MRHSSKKTASWVLQVLRGLSICAFMALCDPPSGLGQAANPTALSGDIPAQSLAAALEAFARLTGLHVLYVSNVVRDQSSRAVRAGLGAPEALARLLQGTGLRFEFLTQHSVRILAAARDPGVQGPGTADESQQYLPEVLVTGSRIPVPANISVASPVQVITANDVLLTGHTDAVDIISELPQIVTTGAADFGNFSNPNAVAGGFATADLRGLRPQRTVVLVNGRRLGIGDPNTNNPTPAPDLDQIPMALVERVEVLTGGASATYGADAVAGVVNFILKDSVQGVQIDGEYAFAQHTQQNRYIEGQENASGFAAPTGSVVDGFRRNLSVLAGSAFHDGDGQVTGYFIYHAQDPVRGSDRDFSACPAFGNQILTSDPTIGNVTPGSPECVGSQNSNIFVTSPLAPMFYSVVGSRFVPWPAAGSLPPAYFNYAPYVYAQRGDKRFQAGMLSHLALNPAARPYLEFSFMDDQTRTETAPSGLFFGENTETPDGGYLVNCSNPLLSAQEAAILCTPARVAADRARPGSVSTDLLIGRRNVEGTARLASYEHRSYRVVGGIQGTLSDDWSYNVYALYYSTSMHQVYRSYFSTAAIDKALQVTTDQSGHPVCISGGSCVPYDIFNSGAVTAQQLAYLYTVGTDSGTNSEQILEADVTGQLARYGFVAPWAHEGVAIDAGAARRTDGLRFAPNAVELAGDMSGFDTTLAALDHRVSVNEGFLEIRAPLVQDRPLAKDLTLDTGYRYSAYPVARTNTYKLDLQYAPTTDLRLRASYDRAIRAPNLIELYTPLSYGVSPTLGADPCAPTNAGATHAAASLAQCLRTGVTAAQYGDGFGPAFGGTSAIAQCAYLGCGRVAGGDPMLAPETADTWSLGVTLTPTALPALSGSIDYFHIGLKGEIGIVPETVTFSQCLVTGDPTVCSRIVRAADGGLNGSIAGGGYILANAVNAGSALVSGIDVQGTFRRALSGRWGALTAYLTGTWVQHNASTPYQGAPRIDCAGLFGNTCLSGSVSPRWRHNLRLTWEMPWDVQVSAQWRFIGRTDFDNNSSQAGLQYQEEGSFDPSLTHIANYSYLDLSGIWAVSPHVQIRAAIHNVFDKDPPFVPQEVSAVAGGLNTFPTYDILGRDISIAIRATF